MTNEFRRLVELLNHAVFGRTSEEKTAADMEKVCEVALRQGVLPLVFGALDVNTRKTLNPKWEQMFFRAMMKNEQKMAVLSGLAKKLEEEKIPYCVLKGCTVAKDYYLSQCRLSGDIDLYVMPQYEKKTSDLLKGLGFAVEPRTEGNQDFKASSPAAGIIEVHVQLYAEVFSNAVLKNQFGITEEFVDMQINEFLMVKSLGINDMLDFLTTHFIKHFVREGSGIRQVTDLLAFVEKHKNEIDFENYFEKLERLKFKKLILNVFGIGVKYFGLDLEDYSLDLEEELMNDIEAGENFGFGEKERFEFYQEFLKKRTKADDSDTKRLVRKRKTSSLKAAILPGRKALIKKGYSYLEKSALLYPVAYAHRVVDIFGALAGGKKSLGGTIYGSKKENKIVNDRLKLMNELDIIDGE